jgi:sulfur-carrier protein
MPVKIEIPTPLREHTAGKSEVEVAGSTVQEALADLVKQFPNIGPKLFDNGKLRPYINIFLNDEDIRYLDEMQTVVKDGQLVALIPAVAGG